MANAKFGTVNHNGKTLTLTQQAFLDCDGSSTGERYWRAILLCRDEDGNEYRVHWKIYDGFDGEDEGDACDWESPAEIKRL